MSSQQIYVHIVIDTATVLENFPNPSQDPSKPTGVHHSSQYMIAARTRGINSGQGTADLSFKANVGDEVCFNGASISDNSEDAVIIYGIKHWNGDQVFNQFVPDLVTRKNAALPDPNTENGLPAVKVATNFSSYDSKVRASGIENFYVYFAIYTLSDDGESQNLKGYFYWDPQITVA